VAIPDGLVQVIPPGFAYETEALIWHASHPARDNLQLAVALSGSEPGEIVSETPRTAPPLVDQNEFHWVERYPGSSDFKQVSGRLRYQAENVSW
jgi:hypothetical protein